MGTRLKISKDVATISIGGVKYEADKFGVIEVESSSAVAILTAKPFNFQPASVNDEEEDPQAETFDAMTKSELVDWLVARGVEIPRGKLKKLLLVELAEEWTAEQEDSKEDGE